MVESVGEICQKSDFVSLHAPYMKATHHLIGATEIAQLKPEASILNFARGELVDDAALAARYDAGGGGRYVCDFALPPSLFSRPNVARPQRLKRTLSSPRIFPHFFPHTLCF